MQKQKENKRCRPKRCPDWEGIVRQAGTPGRKLLWCAGNGFQRPVPNACGWTLLVKPEVPPAAPPALHHLAST